MSLTRHRHLGAFLEHFFLGKLFLDFAVTFGQPEKIKKTATFDQKHLEAVLRCTQKNSPDNFFMMERS